MRFKYSFNFLADVWDKSSEVLDKLPTYSPKIESFHRAEEDFIVSLIKKHSDNPMILDLGCGTGRLLKVLSRNGFTQLYGIDISSKIIEKCRKSLPESTMLLQHDFRERLPFIDNFFDFILITGNALTSSVTESDLVLKQAFRVLKNNGILIVDVYNADFMTEDLVESYYGKFPEPIAFKRFDKKTHTVFIGNIISHWLTGNELKELLEDQNFKIVEIKKEGVGLIGVAKK